MRHYGSRSYLGKLLKRKFIEPYLKDVELLFGQGAYVALLTGEEGDNVMVASSPEPPLTESGQDRSFFFPLSLEGVVVGRLFVSLDKVTSGPFACDDLVQAQVKFAARSIEAILRREHAQRGLATETLDLYREVALNQRAVVSLNRSMKLQDVVGALLNECGSGAFPAEYGMVFLKDGRLENYKCLGSFCPVGDLQLERLASSRLFKEILEKDRGEIINDLSADSRWNAEVPAFSSLLIAPLKAPGITLGALALAGSARGKPFKAAHLKKTETLSSVAGVAMANAYHFEQVQDILMSLIKAMATAIDARDRLTAGHSQRVAQYALGLAQAACNDTAHTPEISFSEVDLQEICYAGLLHDVGKIGVREEVLTKATRLPRPHLQLIGLRLALWGELYNRKWEEAYAHLEIINKAYELTAEDEAFIHKFSGESLEVSGNVVTIINNEERERLMTPRGNLTGDEWQEIKRHPEESIRILQNIPFTTYFPNILKIILQHHERLDGSGYPHGRKGDEILVQSRILAIVDVYDSLRRDRHYKKALSQEMAMTILRQEARLGKLDNDLFDLFCRDIKTIEKIITMDMTFRPVLETMQ